jgi:hypothetical protein
MMDIISIISLSISTIIAVVAIVALLQNRKYIIDQLKILNKQIEIQNEFEYDIMYTEIFRIATAAELVRMKEKSADVSDVYELAIRSPRLRRYLPLTHYFIMQLFENYPNIAMGDSITLEYTKSVSNGKDDTKDKIVFVILMYFSNLLDKEPKKLHDMVNSELDAYKIIKEELRNGTKHNIFTIYGTLCKIHNIP